MFEILSDRLSGIFGRLRSKGRLSEGDIDEVLGEVRIALLEADVNLNVVKEFQLAVKQRCLDAGIQKALNPAQQVVKSVNDELINVLGGDAMKFSYAEKPPTVILLAGLQGVGKTTSAAKLARWFKSQGRNPILVGADLQRPAAVQQLQTLAQSIDVPVFSNTGDPVETAKEGVLEAEHLGRDVVICDTAGRLSVDEEMMEEIQRISDSITPHYTLFVIDSMTGQDAVNVAEAFDEKLELDAMILTKLDGDARGGAALSAKSVVGKPIAFVSTGEKLEDFEQFHPDRLANRILGMGDVLTLIEKAEEAFDKDEAEKAALKLIGGQFTLDDFLDQMQQLKKMGPLQNLVEMMPDMPQGVDSSDIDDGHLIRLEAIIQSMTADERTVPVIIDGSRRSRIAKGSGTTAHEVGQLLKQFKEIKKLMKGQKKPNRKQRNKKKQGGKRKGGRTTPRISKDQDSISVPKEIEELVSQSDPKEFDLSKFGTLPEHDM
ncbi:MAG: signal recognition particle protein [Acidimicrobiaceae bacterium]|nr:signal recognition particle protein [Acidimicrobiaceae bacterium]